MDCKTKVFVYGTLKRGCPNSCLLETSEFIKSTKTKPEYTMLDLGYFPAVLEGGNTSITGEIYEVDDKVLEALHNLEGYRGGVDRYNMYIPKYIELECGERALCYIYNRIKTISEGEW